MKHWRLILKNLGRNKRRTSLTVISIAFSLFLVAFLRTLVIEITRTNPSPASVRRVVVRRSTSLQEQLPESYLRKLESVPDIDLVVGMNWFGGIYKESKNFFANFAVDHEKLISLFPDIRLDESDRQAFLSQRSAAICGAQLAKRFGWKKGDKITLLGTIFPVDLQFDLVGTFNSDIDEKNFYFRRDYFEESLGKPGKVGAIYLLCRSSESVPRVIETVDGMFRNTDAETLTETERAFEAHFVDMLGNVKDLVLTISSVVVFMILLISGNTMAMSIRERSHEIAILKSLGFQNESLIGILVGESVLISLLGGFVGLGIAKILFSSLDMTRLSMGFIRHFDVEPFTLALGFAIALVVGMVSGIVPALHVTRLTVSEGLRRLG